MPTKAAFPVERAGLKSINPLQLATQDDPAVIVASRREHATVWAKRHGLEFYRCAFKTARGRPLGKSHRRTVVMDDASQAFITWQETRCHSAYHDM